MNNPKRILVIDDDDAIREVIQRCLEDIAGWTVRPVNSGWEGLRQVETFMPDVVLLDMVMPGIDGLGVLYSLGQNPETENIPVVLLTSMIDFSAPQQVHELGIAGTITKPFDPTSLHTKVADLLGWVSECQSLTLDIA